MNTEFWTQLATLDAGQYIAVDSNGKVFVTDNKDASRDQNGSILTNERITELGREALDELRQGMTSSGRQLSDEERLRGLEDLEGGVAKVAQEVQTFLTPILISCASEATKELIALLGDVQLELDKAREDLDSTDGSDGTGDGGDTGDAGDPNGVDTPTQ